MDQFDYLDQSQIAIEDLLNYLIYDWGFDEHLRRDASLCRLKGWMVLSGIQKFIHSVDHLLLDVPDPCTVFSQAVPSICAPFSDSLCRSHTSLPMASGISGIKPQCHKALRKLPMICQHSVWKQSWKTGKTGLSSSQVTNLDSSIWIC